jgi:hypothetical protein
MKTKLSSPSPRSRESRRSDCALDSQPICRAATSAREIPRSLLVSKTARTSLGTFYADQRQHFAGSFLVPQEGVERQLFRADRHALGPVLGAKTSPKRAIAIDGNHLGGGRSRA